MHLSAPAELVPIDPGHVDVGDDDVEPLGADAFPGCLTVFGDGHVVSGVFEHQLCSGGLRAAVFDQEYVTLSGVGHAALAKAASFSASPDGRSTTSAAPIWSATPGIPKTTQVSSDCTMVRPPSSRSRPRPSAPSLPMPDSRTPAQARGRQPAIESKSTLTDGRWPSRAGVDVSLTTPLSTVM